MRDVCLHKTGDTVTQSGTSMGGRWSSQDETEEVDLDNDNTSETLTPKQHQAIRETWRVISADSSQFGIRFFIRFFRKHPSYKDFFGAFRGESVESIEHNILLRAHSSVVMNTLMSAIEHMDNPCLLIKRLKRTITNHAGVGVDYQQFEDMMIVFVEHLAEQMGDDFDEVTQDSWRIAITTILTIIRDILKAADPPVT